MQLIAPTPFNTEFLEKMKPYPVRYVYGALPHEPGMRSSAWLPAVDEKAIEAHVKQALAQNIGFLYVLNAACWGNHEFTAQGQHELVDRLGWLESIGADGVVAANPYIIEFVRNRFPGLKVYVSTISNVNSLDKALFYREIGCEGLHLPEYVNRDFKLLREMKKAVNCDISLTVNLCCLMQCPMRDYHANFISHSGESLDRGCYIDYSLMKCTQLKLLHPVELIKATWIRPEDLATYEAIGIDTFKISGRVEQLQWIIRAIDAYSKRSYQGLLNDLLSGLEDIDPFGAFPFIINNAGLNGFLQFFTEEKCNPSSSSGHRLNCGECGYCQQWVERAIKPAGDRQRYQEKLEHTLNTITSGNFRAPML